MTGAGRGLGRGYALDLARRGARVVVNDLGTSTDGATSENDSVASQVVAEIAAEGGAAIASTHDASTIDGTQALVDLAIAEFGTIDGVVTNAGIYRSGIPFASIDNDLLERLAAIHTFGTWRLVQAAWPHFRTQGRGRVVLVTSSAGLYGMANNAAYSMLKAGIIGLTRTLAVEGAPLGILVNAVAPTGWTRMASSTDGDAGLLARFRETRPPEAVTPMIAALLSDEFTVTGEVFSVGAGRVGRVLIGENAGVSWQLGKLEAEEIVTRMDEILAPSTLVFPTTPEEAP
ncbi:SDR family oxidoreductase [Streptomyces sp. NPDC002920]